MRSGTLLAAFLCLAAAIGCGRSARATAPSAGSTLAATWVDRTGAGTLARGPGEPLHPRTDLAPAARLVRPLARLAVIADAHVSDEESPARVPFLDRFGAPFTSTFRPQEALTAQVLAATVRAVNDAHPQAVVEAGDLIDNVQSNELDQALAVLRGGRVNPGSGAPGYDGVQLASDADPFYYRPDVDPPRHPALLAAAQRPFTSPGLRAPWYPVLGNHDVLVQGELAPRAATRAVAVGARALFEPPPRLRELRGRRLSEPDAVDELIARGRLPAGAVRVPGDPRRREPTSSEVLRRLRAASGRGAGGPLLDYTFDVGTGVRGIVLDAARRDQGSKGLIRPAQIAWLRGELARAGRRWVLLFTHQPLYGCAGGKGVLELLSRDPRVLAAVAGHTHRNAVAPIASPAGGFWMILTSSLVDFPQQARALQIDETAGGGAAISTWMLDHAPDDALSSVSRQLAYLDAQGGRPSGAAGTPLDRNARLFKAAPGP